ncbi:hypothetical protein [Lentzea kentuckyensis]|uniref:hypothetical protein n=1 Tax=Lentzea kentuckyensis TaxID=360086 RepID=UPI0013021D9C|nr:hypothetical protein [Lentzea kentuckyensis]
MSMLGTIHGINEGLRAELGIPARPPRELAKEIGWLLGQIDWCATQPWIADVADNIRELHSQTRRLSRDAPPRPVGDCLAANCHGQVYPALIDNPADPYGPRIEGGRCTDCREPYDWIRLIELRRTTMTTQAG